MPRLKNLLLYVAISTVLWSTLGTNSYGALTERFQTNQQGDFVMIGNNSSFDCHSGVPLPIVGAVLDLATCGLHLGGRVLWTVNVATQAATAGLGLLSSKSSSAAVLKLPPGAKVSYARLYWATEKKVLLLPVLGTQLDINLSYGNPPTGISATTHINPDHFWRIARHGLLDLLFSRFVYQGTQDVTSWVQAHGNGTYVVTGIPSLDLLVDTEPGMFSGWSLVVVYELPGTGVPTRHLALWDGFDHVQNTSPSTTDINNFTIPGTGTVNAILGVIGYGGENSVTGDSLKVNTTLISNPLNPSDNFFNSTRSLLGAAVSVAGDLPQTSGTPGSLSGEDLDIVDISAHVAPGDTHVSVQALSNLVSNDFYLGGLVFSCLTNMPSLSTTSKTFTDETVHADNLIRQGDEITYKITVPNTGNDSAYDVRLTDPLPPQVQYKAGSLKIGGVAKSDVAGDDEAEYDLVGRKIIARLGSSASATAGGLILAGNMVTVEFTVIVNQGVAGPVSNQASITSLWYNAPVSAVPLVFKSGDGTHLGVPTVFTVSVGCRTNADCPSDAPICDPTIQQCTNHCTTDQDCEGLSGGPYVCEDVSELDCKRCIPTADLELSVDATPPDGNNAVTYTFTVQNHGPGATQGVTFTYQVPPGATVISISEDNWDCIQSEGVVLCASETPLAVGASATLEISVVGDIGLDSIPLNASVLPVGIRDVNLGNNTVNGTTPLRSFSLQGGGFNCSSGGAPNGGSGLAFLIAACLFGLVLGFGHRLAQSRSKA